MSQHCHQASLESVFELSSSTTPSLLQEEERTSAQHTFNCIINHFEAIEARTARAADRHTYSQAKLIRFTYEYARSQLSQDIFLRVLFLALELDLHIAAAMLHFHELAARFADFAEYLMENFFLPLKASTKKTPQPSPASHSTVLRALGGSLGFVPTSDRLANLRGACLVRDKHRCIVTRNFEGSGYFRRLDSYGSDAKDDDDVLFSQQGPIAVDRLQVAHILPHSLMQGNANYELDKPRVAALAVLNMLDHGVTRLINGVEIDRTTNALTLSPLLHEHFGAFSVYFDAIPDVDNTYRVKSFSPSLSAYFGLPATRTLPVTDSHTIDPPSPRLLAVYRAIAHILHLSGAGGYIDKVLRDVETNVVRADGSSELGRLVELRLGDWVDGKVY